MTNDDGKEKVIAVFGCDLCKLTQGEYHVISFDLDMTSLDHWTDQITPGVLEATKVAPEVM